MAAEHLCHVTTQEALESAGEWLSAEPFLHCCTQAQLGFVLTRHFAGRSGLLVVRFDPQTVDGRIVWERSEPGQDPFPHLYGRFPLAGATREDVPASACR